MILGKVIGTVWSTCKDESLIGAKFLVVRHLNPDNSPRDETIIAVDTVGAGVGDVVLVSQGSSAQQTDFIKSKLVDAIIVGIVDSLDIAEKS